MPATATKPKLATKSTAKPVAKKQSAKKPATKPSATTVLEIGLVELTVDQLWPSPLNPRKTFDPDAINELAASIKADGQVYQNLVARANPGPAGATHEIIAGERRYRSVTQLVAAGDWKPADTVPVRIIRADDAKFIEIATLENMQRKDLTPLEEARAFGQLRDLGRTTDQIADAVGMSLRHVQVRLQLVDTLTPQGQNALEAGEISLAQARSIMLERDAQKQVAFVEELDRRNKNGWGTWSPEQIRRTILGDLPRVDCAIFPIESYSGEIVGNDDNDRGCFADAGQFHKLQGAAIETLKVELANEWLWVEVEETSYFEQYAYDKSRKKTEAGAIIQVHPRTFAVEVHKGLVKKKTAAADDSKPKVPQPDFTKKHLIYAHNKKTAVLQGAVAKDPRTAKILACIALMGGRKSVRIREADRGNDDRAIAGSVIDGLAGIAATLPSKLFYKDTRTDPVKLAGDYSIHPKTEAEVYEALKAIDDAQLDLLFAGLVARNIGTFNDYNPELGDPPLVCAVASDLGIDMTKHWLMDDDYLTLPKKPRLLEIIETGSPSCDAEMKADREKMTGKQLRTAITLRAHMVLPREMQFGSDAELKKGTAINFGPAATAQAAE